ncbi:hypothetical protein ACFL1V_02335 [Pseudomonadota bacterium]
MNIHAERGRKRTLLLLSTYIAFIALASCTRQQPANSPQYEAVTDIRDTMELIIDPAVDVIWDSAGSIITQAGEQDLAPTTPQAWAKVKAAAAVLAESGNLLMMPGRSAGPDWDEHANGLIASGKLAMAAAQQQDARALFDAGGRIYQVCLACHNQYQVDNSSP